MGQTNYVVKRSDSSSADGCWAAGTTWKRKMQQGLQRKILLQYIRVTLALIATVTTEVETLVTQRE